MIDTLFVIALPFATYSLFAFLYGALVKDSKVFSGAVCSALITFFCLSSILLSTIFHYGFGLALAEVSRYFVLAWWIMVIYFLVAFRYRVPILGSILMPVALVFMLVAAFHSHSRTLAVLPMNHIGNVAMFIHIGLVFLSLAFLLLSFSCAILFLLKRNALKKHLISAVDTFFPSLMTSNRMMETSFYAGFPVLTVGIILGIIAAGAFLKSGWIWDDKILFAGFNWCIYSGLFFLRRSQRLENQLLAKGIIFLFFCVVSSFLFTSHQFSLDSIIER